MESATTTGTILISVSAESTYEDHPDVTTVVKNATVPAPPVGDEQALRDWEFDYIRALAVTLDIVGDSWHDVTVTECSDPALVGKIYQFGY